jgi:outer membrane protein TolC
MPAERPNPAAQSDSRSKDANEPLAGSTELSVEPLVAEVQARNPSLQAASAAWRAAAERYPQQVSLDDPMFEYMISPSGLGSHEEDMEGGGWMVQLSQRYPWPGKRQLRGAAALSEADAMRGEIGDTRLRLAESARMAFYDYYLAERLSEVNVSTRKLLAQFREIAATKYESGQATQQDVLQTDVELATLQSRTAELSRDRLVARARINTLLHRAPDCPLPPPPAKLPIPDALPDADVLQEAAVRSRPDLFAQIARVRTEEANVALACKEYHPDVDLRAKYDAFMPEDMRAQVGMQVNVPIRLARRDAAVREACDRLQQRRWEYQNQLDRVRYEVQSALDRASQAREVVRIYQEKTLPAAERNVEAAQANYTSGTIDFLRLIDAERQLNTQRELYHEAVAEYHRRLAELERAVGSPICPTS